MPRLFKHLCPLTWDCPLLVFLASSVLEFSRGWSRSRFFTLSIEIDAKQNIDNSFTSLE